MAGPPYDLGNMITNGTLINKYSLYKPVRFQKWGQLTENELRSVNYGWAIADYTELDDAVAAWAAGTAWVYEKPRGGASEPFRATDFYGYNADAVSIFQPQYNDVAYKSSSNRYFCQGIDQIISWAKFVSYAPTYSGLYIGLVIQRASSSWVYMLTSATSALTIVDILGNETMPFTVDALTTGQTYTIFPILTTYNAGNQINQWITPDKNAGAYWWPIPVAGAEITVRERVQPYSYITGEVTAFDWESEEKGGKDYDKWGFEWWMLNSISFTLSNSGNATWSGKARLKIYMSPEAGYSETSIELPLHTESISGGSSSSHTDTVEQFVYQNKLSHVYLVLYDNNNVQISETDLGSIGNLMETI